VGVKCTVTRGLAVSQSRTAAAFVLVLARRVDRPVARSTSRWSPSAC